MSSRYKKIMVFGKPGSGKSTFSFWLSKVLNIPLFHIDKFSYIHNWIWRDYNEYLNIEIEFINKDCWIIDGNYIPSIENRFICSDLCLYFNFPTYICFYRIFKRFFYKDFRIQDRADGCKEKINFKLLRYTWNYNSLMHDKIKILKDKYPNIDFIEVNSNKSLKQLKNKFIIEKGNP